MSEIKVNTEQLRALSAKLADCHEQMDLLRIKTENAIELINNGTWNSAVGNMTGKMNALKQSMQKLTNNVGAKADLLIKVADQFEEAQKQYINLLPEYAKETFSNPEYYRAENGAIGSVATYNVGGEISCTYYTLRKLRERGLGYPFDHAGGANGGQWFGNCSESYEYKAAGNNSLNELYERYANGGELKNIVVSINGEKNPYGHVVLIDELYKNTETGELMVKYSDNYPNMYDPNATNDQKDITLQAFIDSIPAGGFNRDIAGSVLIGE